VVAGVARELPLPRGKRRVAYFLSDMLGIPRHPEPGTVRMSVGFLLHVDLSSKNQCRMYFSGLYEPNVTKLFKALIAPGDTVIDGGANIGYFSLLSSQYVGETGTVHAFEPVPSTFRALQRNIELNHRGNIVAQQMAISNNSAGLALELPQDEHSDNFKDWAASSVILGQGPIIQTPSCTLDEYAADHGIAQIKLAKLDLEGAEIHAIEGMRRLLREQCISYLICELNASLLDAIHADLDGVRRSLQQVGYRCFHINQRGALSPAELPLDSVVEVVGDYLFVAPDAPMPSM
jgi:FkbM family methyltransferase